MPIAIDLTHTSHNPGLTGVQRVCREVYHQLDAIGSAPAALIHDAYARCWRRPDARELAMLDPKIFAHRGDGNWTFWQQHRGRLGLIDEPDWAKLQGAALLAPEIFNARTFAAYARLRAQLGGVAGAIFYDAVVLRLPQLSPASTIGRFPKYLQELANFNGVAAISEASRSELLDYWKHAGLRSPPPVTAIPLGVEPPAAPPPPPPHSDEKDGPLILCVGTIEGRKNQWSLLEAADMLWSEGLCFQLVLAGAHLPETGRRALTRAGELQAAGRPLKLPGAVQETRLQELYATCRFTVYPSLYEGFGLPVAESLLRHRPCICGSGGALAEVARGGGCLSVPEPTPTHLAQAMRVLLNDVSVYDRLVEEAARRQFPTWADYARQISAWLTELRPHTAS